METTTLPSPADTGSQPPEPPPPRPLLALLREDPSGPPLADAARFAGGLGLAAVLGAAVGLRGGAAATLRHALGAPAALLAVTAFAVPSLWVMLSLASVDVSPRRLLRAVASAAARAGLVMAGLAPAAALFCVSSRSGAAAALGAGACLVLGAGLGLRSLILELHASAAELPEPRQSVATLALAVFGLLSVVLAARVWLAALPVLR